MSKDIGIVASSSEGASLCHRTLCLEASAFMGEHNHPEITMISTTNEYKHYSINQ